MAGLVKPSLSFSSGPTDLGGLLIRRGFAGRKNTSFEIHDNQTLER